MGVLTEERNIWLDSDAPVFVRSVNEGDETVPTVVIGATALVNPSARQVKGAVEGR
jgi:hypothetical protein